MTRGLRNNNPLNIRHSADRWEGARIEQTDRSFVQFKSMAYGYRAAWKTLESYWKHFKRLRQPFTVQNIVHRWAPPSENNTVTYIRFVCEKMGVPSVFVPNVESKPAMCMFAYAIAYFECGVEPMMEEIYGQLLDDLKGNKTNSPIFTDHIAYANQIYQNREVPYGNTEPNQIVVDYIASMTDDYLIDLHRYLFPDSNYYVEYTGYFNDLYKLRNRLQGQMSLEDNS